MTPPTGGLPYKVRSAAPDGTVAEQWFDATGHPITQAQALPLLANVTTVRDSLATALPTLAGARDAADLDVSGIPAAMATITAYAGNPSPSAGQTAAAVKACCTVLVVAVPAIRSMWDWGRKAAANQRRLIRSVLNLFDGPD